MLSRVVVMTFGSTIVGLHLAAIRLDPPLVVFLGGGLVCLLPGLLALALPAGGFGGASLAHADAEPPVKRPRVTLSVDAQDEQERFRWFARQGTKTTTSET
jgi:hypothetical protein